MISDYYYNNINEIVLDFFIKNKLQLLNIFLVGSKLTDNHAIQNKFSDYDSVIIIENNLPINDLKTIRDNLQAKIKQVDELKLYHFKLFSLNEFEKAKHYDGFRIFEFRLNNRTLMKNSIVKFDSIVIDEKNFINSMLIQEVYEKLSKPRMESINKLEIRFKRNIDILKNWKIRPYCIKDFEIYCKKKDSLYNQFKQLKEGKFEWNEFLDLYFKRFRHEFINKGKIYLSRLQLDNSNLLLHIN